MILLHVSLSVEWTREFVLNIFQSEVCRKSTNKINVWKESVTLLIQSIGETFSDTEPRTMAIKLTS